MNRDSPLKMTRKDDHVVISRDNTELAEGIIEEVVAHCPGQVYITVSERCIYNCQFCSVPLSKGKIKTKEEILAIVERAREKGTLKVIALTSGIATSRMTIDRVALYCQTFYGSLSRGPPGKRFSRAGRRRGD